MVKMLKVNGHNIEVYDNEKQGQVLIFAHGLGGNYKQWLEQLAYFDEYRVLAFSLQGHGGSDRPIDDQAYTMSAYGDTVIELMDSLSLKDIIWVGNSMGGVVGYEVLNRRPDLLKLLITNGTTPILKMGKFGRNMIKFMDKLLMKVMSFEGYTKFAAKHSSKDKGAQEKVHQLFVKASPQTIITSHQALGWYDYLETAKNSPIPITIIECPEDKEINNYIRPYKEDLKEVTFKHFENTGHICNLEKPQAYNELLSNIIKENHKGA